VAQGVRVRIRCAANVRPVRVLGLSAQISGQDVFVSMNQLFRDQTRSVVLEVEIQPSSVGRAQRGADVEVGYRNLMTAENRTLQSSATVTPAASAAAVEKNKNRDVAVEVVRQIGAERSQAATALRDEGKIEEAQEAFRINSHFLESNAVMLKDDSLKQDAASNERAGEKVENDAEWNRERKALQEGQYKTQQQRVQSLPK
jgi:hypothetical protein